MGRFFGAVSDGVKVNAIKLRPVGSSGVWDGGWWLARPLTPVARGRSHADSAPKKGFRFRGRKLRVRGADRPGR